MLVEEQGVALGKRKHEALISDKVQLCSDGQTSLQGTQKLGFYKTRRRYRCRRCNVDHSDTDCQGMPITCHSCNQLGHRSYDCRTTKGKGHKGGDQIGQSISNQYGKKHPSTDCQDDLIGCRICGRLGHRYFDCLLTTTGIVNRSHCQTQTLNVKQQPQQEIPTAPNNTHSGESKDNIQTPDPYPQNVEQISEVHNDKGALGGRQNVDDVISVQKIIPDMSKVEPLEGSNYQRWSQRMLILFKALDVDYVLLEDPPTERDCDKTPAAPLVTPVLAASTMVDAEKKEKYEKDNKTVRSHLLVHMNDALFDIFIGYSYAKEIWDMLKKHYEGDDIGKRKHVVGNWLHFVMVDNTPIMEQIHEYENLVADILGEGMKMCETFQAHVLLEKVPPSWSDFCNHLKHRRRDLSLQELINQMQIEEASRLESKRISYASGSVSTIANIVDSGADHKGISKGKGKKFQKKGQQKGQFGFNKSDEKKKLICRVCGKAGHMGYSCRSTKEDRNMLNHKPSTTPRAGGALIFEGPRLR